MGLQTLPSSCSTDEVVEAVGVNGAVIIDDLMSGDLRQQFLDECLPLLDQTSPGVDQFGGTSTRRTGALVAQSAACRQIVQNPLILAAANQFLDPWCRRIQMMLTQIIAIGPGQTRQPLHRDRLAWGGFTLGYYSDPEDIDKGTKKAEMAAGNEPAVDGIVE